MATNKSFKTIEQSHYDLTKVPSLELNRLTGFFNHLAMVLVDVSAFCLYIICAHSVFRV